jgi:hypothetical protein
VAKVDTAEAQLQGLTGIEWQVRGVSQLQHSAYVGHSGITQSYADFLAQRNTPSRGDFREKIRQRMGEVEAYRRPVSEEEFFLMFARHADSSFSPSAGYFPKPFG